MIFRPASNAPGIEADSLTAMPIRGSAHRRPSTERVLGILLWIALALVVVGVGGQG